MFSRRFPSHLQPNRLAQAVAGHRAAHLPLVDLTESNPTRAEIDYPQDLLAPLAHPRGLLYEPSPFGLPDARAAVAGEYARRGTSISADRIVLTASTSEAYSLLFKLLGDSGDQVLVPRPSYPLFDHLTRLDELQVVSYDLEYHGAWTIDIASVERAMTPRTRALLVVSPNNPTGSFAERDELTRLATICAANDVALIADEVFADYELGLETRNCHESVLNTGGALVFSLGGLSKSVGLPQLKLGWIACGGPERLVGPALERLELVCDTYLSVSTPVQAAAADLLAAATPVRTAIQNRIVTNYRRLTAEAAAVPSVGVLNAQGGWYAVLQVPSLGSEEDLVVDLVRSHGVLTHPGYFFDFSSESYLVVSLLTPERRFSDGIRRVLGRFDSGVAGHE